MMIEPREKEIWRYLGYRGQVPDDRVREKIRRCVGELQAACHPLHIVSEFPIDWTDPAEGRFAIAGTELVSKGLGRNLQNCGRVLLFAATLGIGADRLIKKATVTHISDAVIYQAAAAEMIEAYCDRINADLREKYAAEGALLHPRYSPGYGDLSLTYQKDLIRILNTPKQIGLTLTDTLIMMPSKSVTAFIGVENGAADRQTKTDGDACRGDDALAPGHVTEHPGGCALCGKTDCLYRK